MTKRAFIVTGLGYGDEGKGTTVHWLSHKYKAHTVIRTGGPQALHRVVGKDGSSHVFSQFGSGTPRGAATHLSRHMLIDPHAILREGEVLTHESGFRGVFDMMTIHEDALVITPFQAIAGRVRELLRGKNRLGSVGIGVGETMLDSEILKDEAIRAKDLASPSLRAKLKAIQARKWTEFEHYADRASDLTPECAELIRKELAEMEDMDTVQWAIERFGDLAKKVRVVDTDYVAKVILGGNGTVIFEGSQGVLLDRYHGFHPYTTKVRATPATSFDILRECDYYGDVQSLGVLRAYHTRHGGGPFVAESKELTGKLPDASNKEHAWQGNFRVGVFDAIAARYAIQACRGHLDGLVMTCLDRVASHDDWKLCTSYELSHPFKDADSHLKMLGRFVLGIARDADESAQKLKRQETKGWLLRECTPDITSISNPWRDDQKKFTRMFIELIKEYLKFPVVAVSLGETENDKIELSK